MKVINKPKDLAIPEWERPVLIEPLKKDVVVYLLPWQWDPALQYLEGIYDGDEFLYVGVYDKGELIALADARHPGRPEALCWEQIDELLQVYEGLRAPRIVCGS